MTISYLTAVGLMAAGALIATIASIGWRLAERALYRELLRETRHEGWMDGYKAATQDSGLRPSDWGID